MQQSLRPAPAHAAVHLHARGSHDFDLAGLPVSRRVGNVYAYRIATPLARYCAAWMERLGLRDAACYLSGEDLPVEVGGEMWLACNVREGLVAVNLRTPQEFIRRASTGDFDLLMVAVALRQLKTGAGRLCPLCTHHDHPLVHHIILHELVHAVYPEHAWDNRWTDRRVAEFLATPGLTLPPPYSLRQQHGAAGEQSS